MSCHDVPVGKLGLMAGFLAMAFPSSYQTCAKMIHTWHIDIILYEARRQIPLRKHCKAEAWHEYYPIRAIVVLKRE